MASTLAINNLDGLMFSKHSIRGIQHFQSVGSKRSCSKKLQFVNICTNYWRMAQNNGDMQGQTSIPVNILIFKIILTFKIRFSFFRNLNTVDTAQVPYSADTCIQVIVKQKLLSITVKSFEQTTVSYSTMSSFSEIWYQINLRTPVLPWWPLTLMTSMLSTVQHPSINQKARRVANGVGPGVFKW